MVEFPPPHSCIPPKGYLHLLLPITSSIPLGPHHWWQSCLVQPGHTKGTLSYGVSPVLSSGRLGTRPLSMEHLWQQGHPAQGMASAETAWDPAVSGLHKTWPKSYRVGIGLYTHPHMDQTGEGLQPQMHAAVDRPKEQGNSQEIMRKKKLRQWNVSVDDSGCPQEADLLYIRAEKEPKNENVSWLLLTQNYCFKSEINI